MPERNDTVREFIAAFNEDRLADDWIEALFAPDAVVLDFPDIPDRRRYEGHAGVRDFMSDLGENWSSTAIDVEEIRETGDTVIVLGRQKSVGAITDVPVESDFAEVLEFKGNLICGIQMFRNHDEALEAAGA
jgi:ketosteroid isomerase-like protein